ncbi:NUDIX hydrolase [Dysgonomonas sp. HDW5A]|uniref:NUDIX hydrolase n=1 Tax=unclassified Dysgonomonas TaxID=2630389 RepID=UPI001407C768|nr:MULTISPECIES: NUDIX domain-containing protein [unclassified Dysgonomonas]QIK54974.1 NUDIX hydrolase [Dysgonomonas sp. HDW5B]QIK60406.1 NUDIX hydrolase [Dysgonomonas sp. HDW5A]
MSASNILKNISVDCVVFGYERNALRVLLRQEFINYRGRIYEEWKLPGNHVLRDETTEETAVRILREQSGITEDVYLKQLSVFSDVNRLKLRDRDYKWKKEQGVGDNRVVTVAYYSLVNISDIDASHLYNVARWHKVSEVKELIYDHKDILDAALMRLREDLLNNPILFELLPELFTLTELQTLYEIILDTNFDKRNFRRKISNMKYLIPSGKRQENVSHKPAMLYLFDRKIYEKTKQDRFDFSV